MTHQPAIFCKRTWLFMVLAILPILAMEQLIEHFARQSALEQKRISTLDSLAILRARLEGLINSHRLLVHGLTAVISAHPHIDQAEFARISHGLVNEHHALRNIAGAPDLVVSLMYPLAGNEGAIGLDYRTHPIQRATALRAMQTGQSVLAGPVPLAQGGIGIIIREPVFIGSSQPHETPSFWGIVSAVIDIMVFYRESGILEVGSNLRLALRGTDGTGAAGEVFFGDPHVFASNPVIRDIMVPGGTWQLAAIPRSGWSQPTATLWGMRLVGLLAALAAGLIITLLVRGNEALLRQNEILDRTGRLAQVAGWEVDVATRKVSWSSESARIFDLEPGIGDTGIDLDDGLGVFHGDMRQRLEQALREAIEDARPYELELEMITVKGARKWLHTIGIPVREGGQVVRIEGAHQDITSRKLAEIEARQRTAMLDSVFQVLPDLFFLMDADGAIRDYRACQTEDLYAPPDAFLGRYIRDVLPPLIAAEFEHRIALVIETGDLVTYEYALNMPEGIRHFEARLSRLPENSQLIAVVRDITDRKQRENEIRRLNTELEERVAARTAELAAINKELETFSYSVSHDLKAPLRGIDGYSRLLLEDHLEQLDAEGRLFLANVRQGVAQMNELIERVLVERGEEINARHGVVRLNLDADLIAQADPDGLAIVLRNLLDNAVKFSRPDRPPEIDIHGKVMEQSIILSIQDNGIGFDMQFHDRIFEIFQRLQRAEDYPGTGVGLAMVRKAMQRMGGRVWAKSAPGAGATFYLELAR